MRPDRSPKKPPDQADLTTALVLGRARHRSRPWTPPAQALLADDLNDTVDAQDEPLSPLAPASNRHFLIIDNRYGTPIYVFLEADPSGELGFPGFRVRFVTLECPGAPQKQGSPGGIAIGQDPHHLDTFRMFKTDRAVAGAGFILIEPRYVGPNWPAYILAFRPGGEKPGKRQGLDGHAGKRRQ